MRSRSRSPARRHSPPHRSRSSYGNGESSGSASDRCLHCMQTVRRHHPGPEGALPDKDTLKNMIVNPQGARPQCGQTIPVEEVQIPRRYGEGIEPLFGFMSARRVVQILPVRPDEGNNHARSRSSSNQRDSSRRFERHDSRGDSSRRPLDGYRPDRDDERKREERRKDREREEERRRELARDRDRERERSRKREEPIKTEPEETEAPTEDQETHENGGPSHGGHGPRPPQFRPPVRPPMFYPPHAFPPPMGPPMWGPYPPPPRLFHPRPNIRRPPRF
ncbi:zinc finger CCCH domain-containing protein 13-like isoform X2 [Thrips palmi]|nr:zinc finger CCCH domain-containing protein 13-like isoform X2 [Thrips palmi]XP_034245874.1 zinc finger CCCH domain-containing protein 13-like isoform X2 [Thrips palmi]